MTEGVRLDMASHGSVVVPPPTGTVIAVTPLSRRRMPWRRRLLFLDQFPAPFFVPLVAVLLVFPPLTVGLGGSIVAAGGGGS